MITKTDAIVLRSMRYRDTSKIVTFYTRRYGKVNGIAKGARDLKSKFGAALEPMSLVSLVMYKKENRDLHLISHCDLVEQFKSVGEDMEKMTVGMSVIELLNQVTHDEEENAVLFDLLRHTFEALELAEHNVMNLFFAFQIRLGAIHGFALSIDTCLICGRAVETLTDSNAVSFSFTKGGVLCNECQQTHRPDAFSRTLSIASLRALQRFQRAPLDSLRTIHLDTRVGNEVDETLRSYLRYHFEGLRPLKSLEIFHRIKV
ncbi:MAG TPA: DNA repair protein RecO [Bacteroidota bacterium]|nr:DNA repair protein RecO [Bacteroidota bacterium]